MKAGCASDILLTFEGLFLLYTKLESTVFYGHKQDTGAIPLVGFLFSYFVEPVRISQSAVMCCRDILAKQDTSPFLGAWIVHFESTMTMFKTAVESASCKDLSRFDRTAAINSIWAVDNLFAEAIRHFAMMSRHQKSPLSICLLMHAAKP